MNVHSLKIYNGARMTNSRYFSRFDDCARRRCFIRIIFNLFSKNIYDKTSEIKERPLALSDNEFIRRTSSLLSLPVGADSFTVLGTQSSAPSRRTNTTHIILIMYKYINTEFKRYL